MRKALIAFGAAVTFVAASLVALPASAQPSGACNSGEVPPSTTPAGIGVIQTGEPGAGPLTLRVCNDGSTVPAPAKGSVRVTVHQDDPYALIVVDGDSDNTPPPCTSGFVGAKVDADGPHFYGEPSGNWSSNARERIPEGIVLDVVECVEGELPELPDLPDLPDVPEP